MVAAREASSPASISARIIAGVCAFALTPAAAQQQQIPPPAQRAAPSKPTTPAPKTETAKTPRARAGATKPVQRSPGAPASPALKLRPPSQKTAPPPASASPPAAPTESRALPPLPPLDTSVPPPLLPRASHERMHACADEWNGMKRKSVVGLPTWRDFATGCLTRPAAPAKQKTQGAETP